jgi:hypothetical protein
MSRLVLLAAALLLAGCESTRDGESSSGSDSSVATHRPVAYHPEQFPDIPFERLVGYRLTAEEQQIALATAGGALRHLSVTFITKPGDEPRPPVAEADRIASGLIGLGWKQSALPAGLTSAPDDHRAAYTKNDETLLVHAYVDGSATSIAFLLEPRAHLEPPAHLN